MSNNDSLLSELEQILKWKKSKQVYASHLNISIEEVDELMKELRNRRISTGR